MVRQLRGWFFEQLAIYAAYHRDTRNQITHHVGVPLIVFSLLVTLTQARVTEVNGYSVTAAALLLGSLIFIYVLAVPSIGLMASIFYGAVYWGAVTVAESAHQVIWIVASVVFVAGWVIQFIGHAFEGRRPALTVNAFQVFMAPPFLIAEVLFAAGFEKNLETNLKERAVKYLPRRST